MEVKRRIPDNILKARRQNMIEATTLERYLNEISKQKLRKTFDIEQQKIEVRNGLDKVHMSSGYHGCTSRQFSVNGNVIKAPMLSENRLTKWKIFERELELLLKDDTSKYAIYNKSKYKSTSHLGDRTLSRGTMSSASMIDIDSRPSSAIRGGQCRPMSSQGKIEDAIFISRSESKINGTNKKESRKRIRPQSSCGFPSRSYGCNSETRPQTARSIKVNNFFTDNTNDQSTRRKLLLKHHQAQSCPSFGAFISDFEAIDIHANDVTSEDDVFSDEKVSDINYNESNFYEALVSPTCLPLKTTRKGWSSTSHLTRTPSQSSYASSLVESVYVKSDAGCCAPPHSPGVAANRPNSRLTPGAMVPALGHKQTSVHSVVRVAMAFRKSARKEVLNNLVEKNNPDKRKLIQEDRLNELKKSTVELNSLIQDF